MSFNYLENAELQTARESFLSAVKASMIPPREETIRTVDAVGHVTARAVYAAMCAPHYAACAMDGVALAAERTFGATETTPVTIKDGEYIFVDTGDPLPKGCDAVVMAEDVIAAENGITVYTCVTPWQNIRQIGEDVSAGDMILASYSVITPSAAGAMLAAGVNEAAVLAPPTVGIIPTGDEIVEAGKPVKSGDIIEFNSTIFSGMLKSSGANTKVYPIVRDEKGAISDAVRTAIAECDVVLINGGSSAGREDYTCEVISSLGSALAHGLAIKPGKPAVLGICEGKPVIGVPGYPVSGIVIIEEIVEPLLALYTKRGERERPTARAVISKTITSSLKYEEFLRVRLGMVDGRLVASPLARGAGVVSSFVKADGVAVIPQNSEGCAAGSKITVRLNRPLKEIERSVVATGSHDPLIDEIADIMKRSGCGFSVASSHVGSMGAINAIARKEAHLGGVHLLSDDGVYNIGYLQKRFKAGEVSLISGVQRVQGLMVKKGNPKKINSIDDLARNGISFVNRQGGSGTRVLLDFLLRQKGIDQNDIYGYSRVELTHTGVAAQVAADADAGLGILAAARIYGLDFIPVADEQYDFLILQSALENEGVRLFLEILKSREFAERIIALGGYGLKGVGEEKQWI